MSRIAFIISAIMLAALWGCENNGSSAGNTLSSDDIAEDDERERPSRDEARAKRTKSKREKRPAREDRRPPPRSKSKADIPAPDDVSEPPNDAERTKSGLASKVLKAGSGGENPNPTDTVKVHYTGWTTDGEMFDSSVTRGEPISFPLNKVIKGWTEGVGLMVEGEKRRLWIPEELAYKGRPGRPAGMLVFDVELLEIVSPPEPPADVAAPPDSAKRTTSGLASRVLAKGHGSRHPRETSRVKVHYTGWTTDGEMFDSSVARGEPAMFPLNGVIKGWTEGLQLMVEGEKRRIWIPEELAYKGRPGRPQGMLVFDVELLEIIGE